MGAKISDVFEKGLQKRGRDCREARQAYTDFKKSRRITVDSSRIVRIALAVGQDRMGQEMDDYARSAVFPVDRLYVDMVDGTVVRQPLRFDGRLLLSFSLSRCGPDEYILSSLFGEAGGKASMLVERLSFKTLEAWSCYRDFSMSQGESDAFHVHVLSILMFAFRHMEDRKRELDSLPRHERRRIEREAEKGSVTYERVDIDVDAYVEGLLRADPNGRKVKGHFRKTRGGRRVWIEPYYRNRREPTAAAN